MCKEKFPINKPGLSDLQVLQLGPLLKFCSSLLTCVPKTRAWGINCVICLPYFFPYHALLWRTRAYTGSMSYIVPKSRLDLCSSELWRERNFYLKGLWLRNPTDAQGLGHCSFENLCFQKCLESLLRAFRSGLDSVTRGRKKKKIYICI